jgi:medium-chain acyl-[acyl-carrier-protein] hydrolase
MTSGTGGSWFPSGRPGSAAAPALAPGATALFCLPHAGAGASAYRLWPELLAPGIEVVPVQLPGREGRYHEPARRSAAELAAELIGPVSDRAGAGFAIFGHSMGALVGYELAHALTARNRPVRHLFVSGLRPPHLAAPERMVHRLPDSELIDVLVELEGCPPDVLKLPDLVRLLLPVLRADFEVCETYRCPPHRPLPVPITAMCGDSDPTVNARQLREWRSLTSSAFNVSVFPGGHFYLQTRLRELAAVLAGHLRESISRDQEELSC